MAKLNNRQGKHIGDWLDAEREQTYWQKIHVRCAHLHRDRVTSVERLNRFGDKPWFMAGKINYGAWDQTLRAVDIGSSFIGISEKHTVRV